MKRKLLFLFFAVIALAAVLFAAKTFLNSTPPWQPDFEVFLNQRLQEVYFPAKVQKLFLERGEDERQFSFHAWLKLVEDLYQQVPPDAVFEERVARAMRVYARLSPHLKSRLEPLELAKAEIYRKIALSGEELVIQGSFEVQRASHDRWLFKITDVVQTELIDGRSLPKAKPWVLEGSRDAAQVRQERADALNRFEKRLAELEFEDVIQRRMERKR